VRRCGPATAAWKSKATLLIPYTLCAVVPIGTTALSSRFKRAFARPYGDVSGRLPPFAWLHAFHRGVLGDFVRNGVDLFIGIGAALHLVEPFAPLLPRFGVMSWSASLFSLLDFLGGQYGN